ncbi:MAG: DUF2079 domain-containing protein [Myxococcaceae bacterium]|nr:DUF2079 domain-containing protein [Myxococcaceae bacterium]
MLERWVSPGRLAVVATGALGLAVVLGPVGVPFGWLQPVVGALVLVSWWRRPFDLALALDPRVWRWFLAAALVWLELVGLTRFEAFEVDGVALGALEQALDGTHHGRFGATSMLGGSYFASAPALILLPLVFLHELWPGPLWLVVTGPLVVWLGLFPVRRLVRLSNGGPHGAMELAASLAWLGNGLTGRALAEGFSLELVLTVLFLWLVVAWVERDVERVAALAAAMLITKDEAAVVLVGFVVAATLVERWRWGQALFVAGLAIGWSLFTGLVLRPRLLGPAQVGPWTPWDAQTIWHAFGRLWREPVVALGRVVTSGWWRVLGPMLLVPLRSARAVGALLPLLVLLALGAQPEGRAWQTPMAAGLVGVLLFGVFDVWAVWRSAPGSRAREGLVLAAFVGFGALPPHVLRVHAIDVERRQQLEGALKSVERAPLVCVQPVLVPHLGTSRRLVPLVKPDCIDRPGAVALVHLSLSPAPWTQEALEALLAGRRAERLAGGFVVVNGSAQ